MGTKAIMVRMKRLPCTWAQKVRVRRRDNERGGVPLGSPLGCTFFLMVAAMPGPSGLLTWARRPRHRSPHHVPQNVICEVYHAGAGWVERVVLMKVAVVRSHAKSSDSSEGAKLISQRTNPASLHTRTLRICNHKFPPFFFFV